MRKTAQVPAPDPGVARLPAMDRFLRPGLPKYVALRDAVVHAVTSGNWPPGARLPNESDLAAALPLPCRPDSSPPPCRILTTC